MCASAIAWGGYRRIFYLFSHEDSRDSFAIGHDLRILEELYGLPPAGYRRKNAYWTAESIPSLIAKLPAAERAPLQERLTTLHEIYAALSATYQRTKGRAPNIVLP